MLNSTHKKHKLSLKQDALARLRLPPTWQVVVLTSCWAVISKQKSLHYQQIHRQKKLLNYKPIGNVVMNKWLPLAAYISSVVNVMNHAALIINYAVAPAVKAIQALHVSTYLYKII